MVFKLISLLPLIFVFFANFLIGQSITDTNFLTQQFCFPVGDADGKGKYKSILDKKVYNGWNIATAFGDKNKFGIHPGEDWNGNGGGNTDAYQPVYNIASGKVLDVEELPFEAGKAIKIEHIFKNKSGTIDTVYSVYVHLDSINVKPGDVLSSRQKIAVIFGGNSFLKAHLHLEIRKSSIKNYPLLYYPSLESKEMNWIKENYFHPSDFIRNHRKM